MKPGQAIGRDLILEMFTCERALRLVMRVLCVCCMYACIVCVCVRGMYAGIVVPLYKQTLMSFIPRYFLR